MKVKNKVIGYDNEVILPSLKYRGQYCAKLIEKDLLGREYIVKEYKWKPNDITVYGYNDLARSGFARYCYLGNEITTPNAENNFNRIIAAGDNRTNDYYYNNYPHTYTFFDEGLQKYVNRTIQYYRFDPDFNPNNAPEERTRTISKIGIGRSLPTNLEYYVGLNAFSIISIETPNTFLPILQTDSQFLDIYYQLDVIIPDDVTGSIILKAGNGISFTCNYLIRPALINDFTRWNSIVSFWANSHPHGPRCHGFDGVINTSYSGQPLGRSGIVVYAERIPYIKDSFIYKRLFTIPLNFSNMYNYYFNMKSLLVSSGNSTFQIQLNVQGTDMIHDGYWSMQLPFSHSIVV